MGASHGVLTCSKKRVHGSARPAPSGAKAAARGVTGDARTEAGDASGGQVVLDMISEEELGQALDYAQEAVEEGRRWRDRALALVGIRKKKALRRGSM